MRSPFAHARTAPADHRPASLQRTLLLWWLPALALLVPLGALLIYWLALMPALDALDRALTDSGVALAEMIDTRGGQVSLPISEQTARALRADLMDDTEFAVTAPDGRLLGGHAALAALASPVVAGQWRFADALLQGRAVRLATHGVACGGAGGVCTVLLAETLTKRAAARRAALLGAVLGALALALPLAGVAVLAVRRALRPLEQAAREVASLTPERLRAVDTRGVPVEVAGFMQATNQLLTRLQGAAEVQRRFVADAAHQLRTPLAVVRVEAAELLARPHPPELAPALRRLHEAAERGSRLAQQLLMLARAEGMDIDPGQAVDVVDLRQLAAGLADEWLQPALRAGQDLGFDLQPAWVQGHPVLLAELIGNLVHNATVHAGRGARVTVRTRTLGAHAQLVVEDDGPGVPDDELARLGQRFQRGRGARGDGSGLGLAIVRDIARLHGARVDLEPGEGGRGLRVCVEFSTPSAGTPAQSP